MHLMPFLLVVLCLVGIAALVYLIKALISFRQLALTVELRIRHTTERLETTLDGVDVLTANATSLVMELNEKLPGTIDRTDAMLDRIQDELVPTLHNANEATGQLSEMAHIIGVRVSSLDKVFSWLQLANVIKGATKTGSKLGILSSVVQSAVQMGLPWFKGRHKTTTE